MLDFQNKCFKKKKKKKKKNSKHVQEHIQNGHLNITHLHGTLCRHSRVYIWCTYAWGMEEGCCFAFSPVFSSTSTPSIFFHNDQNTEQVPVRIPMRPSSVFLGASTNDCDNNHIDYAKNVEGISLALHRPCWMTRLAPRNESPPTIAFMHLEAPSRRPKSAYYTNQRHNDATNQKKVRGVPFLAPPPLHRFVFLVSCPRSPRRTLDHHEICAHVAIEQQRLFSIGFASDDCIGYVRDWEWFGVCERCTANFR